MCVVELNILWWVDGEEGMLSLDRVMAAGGKCLCGSFRKWRT